jgi:mRNA interferase HigB
MVFQMRIISKAVLVTFWIRHPHAKAPLSRWIEITRAANWQSIHDVLQTFPNAKGINAERVRFAVHGGDYRMIVAFFFEGQTAYIKFIGTHADYDAIDATKVSLF